MLGAEEWIERLDLTAHPEGGFYKETYRNPATLETSSGKRSLTTSIYFLLNKHDKSHFHQLTSDELWYHHAGTSCTLHLLDPSGDYLSLRLGNNPLHNESLQVLIPAGSIFAAEVNDKSSFTLMGCVVSPGFDFGDFKLYKKEELRTRFPQHDALIDRFTAS